MEGFECQGKLIFAKLVDGTFAFHFLVVVERGSRILFDSGGRADRALARNLMLCVLQLEISCVRTGVKNLHQEAQRFPVAVYFEANGHGTVTCKRDEVNHWGMRAGITEV